MKSISNVECPACKNAIGVWPRTRLIDDEADRYREHRFEPIDRLDYTVPELATGKDSFYLCPASSIQGGMRSAIWKVWRHKDEIYIAAPTFKKFKISIHSSGWDNLSWLNPNDRAMREGAPKSMRVIERQHRSIAPEGCLVHIFDIDICGHFASVDYWSSNLKKKHLNSMLFFNSLTEQRPVFRISGMYSSNPLGTFRETTPTSAKLVRTFKTLENEYISIFVSHEREVVKAIEFDPVGMELLDEGDNLLARMRFGRARSSTLYVNLEQFI